MCGIAGLIVHDGESSLLDGIFSMTRALRHRGPDDEGYCFFDPEARGVYIYGGTDTPDAVYRERLPYTPASKDSVRRHGGSKLVFGHRRLSILDLSGKGHQPMCTPDSRYWIVYNGEIYNYLELREELIEKGYCFQSGTDTEVLLNAFVHWGVGAFPRFVGMFAFAIYDREKREVLLGRDFFGIKPLYYTVWRGGFAFASEIKALLTLPHLSRKVNPQRVYEYLRFGLVDHGEETLLREIRQLPAAHFLRFSARNPVPPNPLRYWDVDRDTKESLPMEEASCLVRHAFLENIKLHLRSDVPLGAALSGGIDSSAIVMGMREVQGGSLDLNTFSFISEDSRFNEEKWVDMVGFAGKARMHKVKASPTELVDDFDKLIEIQDEPFFSTSIYAQFRVMSLAKEKGIKVMLDGQGADEMLGGYRTYLGARLGSLVRQLHWIKALEFFSRAKENRDYRWEYIIFHALAYLLPQSIRSVLAEYGGLAPASQWLRKKWFEDQNVKMKSPAVRVRGKEILKGELYQSLMEQQLISLLRYEDRNSMAFSIESRVPFLTPRFVNLVHSLPEEYIIDLHARTKAVFREAMKGIVPAMVLERKDKIGFATPEEDWLQRSQGWVERILNSDAARQSDVYHLSALKKGWNDFLSGRKSYNYSLWRAINFIRWSEQCKANS